MHVAIVGGASTVGSTVAYTLASLSDRIDVTLVDKAEEAAWGHAKDAEHASFHFADAPVEAGSVGRIRDSGTGRMDEIDPDLVVLTAAAPRDDDSTEGDPRGAWLRDNVAIADAVADDLRAIDPVPVVVVTNPVDRITYRLWDQLDWPRGRFIGYTLSETARTADAISRIVDADLNAVSCPVMGEHGERPVPLFSRLRVDGEPVDLSPDEREEVIEYVREIAFDIADGRGIEDSSRWVTSAGVTRVIRAIRAGGSEATLCLSTPLDGEYGIEDGCLSVPVELSEEGVADRIEWELSDEERERLAAADEAIQADLESL